jgi:hypothetical protein
MDEREVLKNVIENRHSLTITDNVGLSEQDIDTLEGLLNGTAPIHAISWTLARMDTNPACEFLAKMVRHEIRRMTKLNGGA